MGNEKAVWRGVDDGFGRIDIGRCTERLMPFVN